MVRSEGLTLWRVAAVIGVLWAAGGRAEAQSASVEAEALFRQGKDLMAANKIAEACAAFDLSQKLDPRTTTLVNQANCRERNGQLATAWGLFLDATRLTRAATDAAGQQLHAVAADRAAKLEQRLSTLQIDVPAESRLAGLEILRNDQAFDAAAWNKPLPIDGGTYRITARAPGAVEWSTEITVATERDAKQVEIPKLARAKVGARPGGDAKAAPAPRDATSSWTGRRKVAVAVAGGGVAVLAIGGVLGALASSKQHDAHALCPSPASCDDADRANDLIRSGHSLAIEADVAFGVAAAAVIAASTLWFTGAPESHPGIAIAPAAAPGRLVLTASARF